MVCLNTEKKRKKNLGAWVQWMWAKRAGKRKINSHVRPHEEGMGCGSMVKAQHDVTVK